MAPRMPMLRYEWSTHTSKKPNRFSVVDSEAASTYLTHISMLGADVTATICLHALRNCLLAFTCTPDRIALLCNFANWQRPRGIALKHDHRRQLTELHRKALLAAISQVVESSNRMIGVYYWQRLRTEKQRALVGRSQRCNGTARE